MKDILSPSTPLEKIEGVSSAEIAAELVEAFKKIWIDSWGARMEDLLRNTLIALIEAELTLDELPRFLIDDEFRENVLERVTHPIAKRYFQRFNALAPEDQGRVDGIYAEQGQRLFVGR